MPPSASTARRYLRVADLARLRNLVFAPRGRVEGLYAGRHASPQRGHSVEFNDYREYSPGDPPNDLDWKVYGRSDKLFLKLFEHQTDMTVQLLVDASASMAYRGLHARRPAGLARSWLNALTLVNDKAARSGDDLVYTHPSKYDQACLCAASIAFLTIKQQDKAGIAFARSGLADHLRPAGAYPHLQKLLTAMEDVEPRGEAELARAIHDLTPRTRGRSLLVVFSDLLEDPPAIIDALSHFTHRGSEAIVFQVLHADELALPRELNEAIFVDSESGHRLRLNVDDVRDPYHQALRASQQRWARELRSRRIDYNTVSTATPYHQALEGYLITRAAMQ